MQMQHLNSWQRQQRAITNANNIGKTEAETEYWWVIKRCWLQAVDGKAYYKKRKE
jgi:hypothetical protein